MKQSTRTRGSLSDDIPSDILRVRVDWQHKRGKNFPTNNQHIRRGSFWGCAGTTKTCSGMFDFGKVDGDKLTHLFELNPSAFCILNLLVQYNFLERRLFFMKQCTEGNFKNLTLNVLFRV